MKFAIGILFTLLLVQASTAYSVREPYANIFDKVNTRITDGKDAYPGQFPYQVSLQWGLPPLLRYRHACGGSIINENWILTAGHCVTSMPRLGKTNVKVGKHHIINDDEHVQTVEIAKKIVHENYPGKVAPYDIALLKLKTPLVFNERIQPVQLPKQGTVQSGEATLSGWGSVSKKFLPKLPQVLQTVDIPIVDNKACDEAVKAISSSGEVTDSMMCTGPLNSQVSACSGDSGGPLVQYENEKPVVVGVVSWGLYPCGSGAPSVYTRVSSYVDWINTQISQN